MPDNLLLHMQQKVAEAKSALKLSELFGRGFAARLEQNQKPGERCGPAGLYRRSSVATFSRSL
jgi:hypothetical protein